MCEICVSLQFRAIDPPNPARGFIQQIKINAHIATAACIPKLRNARFATAACAEMYETYHLRPRQLAACKNHNFTTVSGIRRGRSDERVAGQREKFAFRYTVLDIKRARSDEIRDVKILHFAHSFGRPTSTK